MVNFENILNLITGNRNTEENKDVLPEVGKDPDFREFYSDVKTTWAFLSTQKKMGKYQVDKSFDKIRDQITGPEKSSRFGFSAPLKYAAAILVLAGIFTIGYFTISHKSSVDGTNSEITSLVAESGQVSKVILPDSSVVWLNSGSVLQYNQGYTANNRNLKLVGQAYLEVKKDPDHPLIVDCGDLSVRVLGTVFEICAYPEEAEVEVKLKKGKVEVFGNDEQEFNYQLSPGEMAQYSVASQKMTIGEFDPSMIGGWKDGNLVFKGSAMADVIRVLERRFGVEIVVKDSEVNTSVLNAYFYSDEDIAEILELIKMSCGIDYKIIDNTGKGQTTIELFKM